MSWLFIGALFLLVWNMSASIGDGIDALMGDSDSEPVTYPCACGCGRRFTKITGWDGMHSMGPLASTDRCVTCHEHVLPENTYLGMCEDCLYDSGTYVPTDDEWAAIMLAVDDEKREGRDHR